MSTALPGGFATTRLVWPRYHRLISSAYPPIDLFEDIADPADWELLAAAEAKSNPRVAETIGSLDLVPAGRRVSGPGASYVMAPFTHVSPERKGRFHDGSFGAFYAARSFDTALFEVAHHQARFFAATGEAPGWIADMRELVGEIDADMVDLTREDPAAAPLLDPDDYGPSQTFAAEIRAAGHNGIAYPSVRHDGGACFAAFHPDVMSVPIQACHLTCHWDGKRIDMVKIHEAAGENPRGRIFRIEA
ncbi:RES family NAD+ phosphorylase [Stappia indica]|uniref:RES family NAD+ phosphorylase n=1 Tax=Stappia indica TaxID=538381 RepID=UPI0008317454|nr:RES family NAD+ phosphorylase [Stappia indica]MCC4243029.1 RES family NAD+ phosphorylase [Stappia indica]